MTTIQEITDTFDVALHAAVMGEGRSLQSQQGILGPSDIGFCRQKAVLMTRGTQATDSRSLWAATVGTALHKHVENLLKPIFPEWIFPQKKVTATLPNGSEISGTPDIVVPEWNAVLDLKTVDGFEWVKRSGTSINHKYQRHLYAMGAIAEGWLDDSKPIKVGNVYLDRSGKISTPLVTLDDFDDYLSTEIAEWVNDVIYAVKNNEDASRDVVPAVCEKICEFFTACRGSLPDSHDPALIEDPDLISAVEMYVEGGELEKTAKRLKDEAKAMLVGVNGSTKTHQVRWTEVGPSEVKASYRDGYTKIDIRKVRR